jgi:hypothetical protein
LFGFPNYQRLRIEAKAECESGLDPESIVAVDAGDSFRKVQTVSHQRMGKVGIRESSASVGIVCKPTQLGSIVEVKRIGGEFWRVKKRQSSTDLSCARTGLTNGLDAPQTQR